MPTTAWSVARTDIMRPLGFISVATTTNITTNNSIISANLADDFDQDKYLIGWYAQVVTAGVTNATVVRRVTAYTASTGTLTVAGVALGAESGVVTVELTRHHPDIAKDHFNRARLELFPQIALIRNLDTLITGQKQHRFTLPSTLRGKPLRVYLGSHNPAVNIAQNEVVDPGFEDWVSATSLTSWTLSGTGSTVNQQEATTSPSDYLVFEGGNSARILNNASDGTTLLQTVIPKVATERVEANASVWVYSTQSAISITARLASTDGVAHGGTGWERLVVAVNIGEGTSVSVGVAVGIGTAFSCYVDEFVMVLGQSEPIDEPWEEIENWVWIPPVAGAADGGILEFSQVLGEKRRIRIVGRDFLSAVSADTDTVEISGEQLSPLYNYTRMLMAQDAANTSQSGARDYWRQRAAEFEGQWRSEFDRGNYVRMPNPRPRIPIL
jgi:hypothetical protein